MARLSRRDRRVFRAEDAEYAEKRGGDRVARPVVARAGDPAAPAPLCVLGALYAIYSAIFAREVILSGIQSATAPGRPASTTSDPLVVIGRSRTVTLSSTLKSARIEAGVAVQAT